MRMHKIRSADDFLTFGKFLHFYLDLGNQVRYNTRYEALHLPFKSELTGSEET